MNVLRRVTRILDLFCGAGGAAMGYHQAFPDAEIVGVDNRPQPHYPFEFILADALEYPLEGFDFIHASPPCQAYSATRHLTKRIYPMLIEPVRNRLEAQSALWVIENVVGAPLWNPIMLCGTAFGLGLEHEELRRHRLFESSMPLVERPCDHRRPVVGVYGHGRRGCKNRRACTGDCRGHSLGVVEARVAMGIDWMNRDELSQAIPPTYTRWIGEQLTNGS